jgi:aminomethyltransferase
LTKSRDFPSKESCLQQKNFGVEKKLLGIVVDDRRVPRHGYPICDVEGNEIGIVTSGTMSPSLQIPIGMAYVPSSLSHPGSQVLVKAGAKMLEAKVVKVPFIAPNP